jgi:hypothetical protein
MSSAIPTLSDVISQLEGLGVENKLKAKERSKFNNVLKNLSNVLKNLREISQSKGRQPQVPKPNMPEESIAGRHIASRRSGGNGGPTWRPTCKDLEGDMESHRADGNCLCYALYESCGNDETLGTKKGSKITARNLRRLMVEKQLKDLQERCRGVSVNIDQNHLLCVIKQVNPSGNTQNLSADKVFGLWDGIQNEYNKDLREWRN